MVKALALRDPVSQLAYRDGLADLAARNWANWSLMNPLEWPEAVRRMPDEHGATQKFSFDYAPYQREMYAELFNPRNQEVVFQLYSRGGKSETVLNALGEKIHQRPCRIGVMWPTLGQGKKWSKDDFMGSLVDPTPELSELIGDCAGRRKSDNTILHKIFDGGLIDIIGANAPGDIRRLKARLLYCDEIDAIVEIQTDEGDQLALFKMRGSEFADTLEVYCSYPSIKGKSRIEAKELETDGRRWPVPCLKCGWDQWIMHRRDLRYDADKPEGALIECPHCHDFHDDAARYQMSRLPEKWTPTREFRGKAGFQAGAMLWPHKVSRDKYPGGFLQMLAQREIDVEKSDNPERSRRTLVNMFDAETYQTEFGKKPEHTKLFLRREKYDPEKMLPAGVLWIAITWDVQAGRTEGEVIGYGLRNQTWGLGYHVIKGSPLVPVDQGVWAEMDRIFLTSTFPHPSGKTLRIEGELVDRGYAVDHVLAYTRPRASRGTFASRGATSLSRPLISRRAKLEGNPKARVWELGTHEAKDIIYQRLDRDNVEADGYMHFPAIGSYGEPYFKMLTAEDSEEKKGGDGKWYRFFSCEKGVRNEALDLRVMGLAILKIRRPKFAKLAEELRVREAGEAAPAAEKGNSTQRRGGAEKKGWVRNAVRASGKGNFVKGWRR